MKILRLVFALALAFVLSYGLVTISSGHRIFSYERFARLALFLTPVLAILILLAIHYFPPPTGWMKSTRLRREILVVTLAAGFTSLALTPSYEGLGRTAVTIVIITIALVIWGLISTLPILNTLTLSDSGCVSVRDNDKFQARQLTLEAVVLGVHLLVGAIGTIIFLIMAAYTRMYGDDWCYHTRALTMGIFDAAIQFYMTWSGRFFSNFLLFTGAGNRWTPMFQLLLIAVVLFICSYILAGKDTPLIWKRWLPRISWSLACALLIPFLIYAVIPDPYKSLYWIVSSVVVLPFVILLPIFLVFARGILDTQGINHAGIPRILIIVGYTFLGFGLAFSLATIHEVATIPILILCGFLFLVGISAPGQRKERLVILGFALAGSLAGLLVTYLSPGNAGRHAVQGYPQPPDLIALLRITSYYFWKFVEKNVIGHQWFALVPAFILGYLVAQPGKNRWNPAVVLGLSGFMAWSCFLPGAYAAQDKIPMRSELIPVAILVFGAFSAGYLSPKSSSYISVSAILSIALLISIFFFVGIIDQKARLVNPIVEFSEEWDVRDARMRTTNDPVYLINPPWDFKEQAEDCINIYYNYLRQGK